MKTAVVYYSLSGTTRRIAQSIANALGADLMEIKTKHSYPRARWLQMVVCGASASFKRKPELLKLSASLSDYGNIVLGAPVWAGTIASPMNAFLHAANLAGKNVALFVNSGGGDAEKPMRSMKEALHASRIVGESSYRSASQTDGKEQTDRAAEWAKNLPFA